MLLTLWNVTEEVASKYSDENLFSATLFPPKPTCIGLKLNQGLRGGIDCKYLLKGKSCFKSRLTFRKADGVNRYPVH